MRTKIDFGKAGWLEGKLEKRRRIYLLGAMSYIFQSSIIAVILGSGPRRPVGSSSWHLEMNVPLFPTEKCYRKVCCFQEQADRPIDSSVL